MTGAHCDLSERRVVLPEDVHPAAEVIQDRDKFVGLAVRVHHLCAVDGDPNV